MAVSYQLLTLVAVLLLSTSRLHAKSVVPANTSSNDHLFPSFPNNFFDIHKFLEGFPFFKRPRVSSFPRVEDINGTKIWTLELNVQGFKASELNATRKGLALQVIGLQVNDNNQTREIMYQQSLPPNADLNKLQAVMNKELTITVPMKEEKMVQIPIKTGSELSFKPEVHIN